jgi:hypothetical protein
MVFAITEKGKMTMDKATQRGMILGYCAENGSITVREAFTELGINSPTKRISEIRNSGDYKVETIEESRTHNGVTKRWKRYFITPLGSDKS